MVAKSVEKDVAATAAIAFKPETEEVAKFLQERTTYEVPTGATEAIGTATPDAYEQLLLSRTSLTVAHVKELQKLNTTVVAAGHLMNGRVGLPIMKDNAQVETVSFRLPMIGRDAFEATLHRSKEVSAGNPNDRSERKTVLGVSRGALEIHAEGTRGELTKVKQFLNAEAATMFS